VENLAMTTIATHKTDLHNLLQKTDFIIENIKNVQEKTDQRDDQSIKLREYYLKNQEEDMQSILNMFKLYLDSLIILSNSHFFYFIFILYFCSTKYGNKKTTGATGART